MTSPHPTPGARRGGVRERPITYATVCSGINAPGVAWHRLGWRCAFHSEIEPFPCAVLAHHEPQTPNLGNMEAITREQIEGYRPVSVFCAGTPCQSFSVAGLRAGMADPHGNLALVFLRLVDWLRPRWVVWENVPGVHSSWTDDATFAPSEASRRTIEEAGAVAAAALGVDAGAIFGADDFEEVDQSNDFDCFLSGLEQLGYGIATRVFDAQHFGIPQRRRRVFVVGCLRGWSAAAAVLLERHSLSGNPPPSREAGAGVAASLTRGADSGGRGGYAGRRREDDYNVVNCVDRHMGSGGPDDNAAQAGHLVGCLTPGAHPGGYNGQDAYTGHLIAHALRAEGFDASEDGTGRGTPLVPVAYQCQGSNIGPMGTVRAGNGNHTGGVPFIISSANSCEVQSHGRQTETARALDTTGGFRPQQGGTVVAVPIQEVSKRTGKSTTDPRAGIGIGEESDPMFTLQAGAQHGVAVLNGGLNHNGVDRETEAQSPTSAQQGPIPQPGVEAHSDQKKSSRDRAFAFQTRCTRNDRGMPSEVVPALTGATCGGHADTRPHVGGTGMAVRRLTVIECARLQGFPDTYLHIPLKSRKIDRDEAAYLHSHSLNCWQKDGQWMTDVPADGPMYRAFGNSMPVPVLFWIGQRIEAVEKVLAEPEAAHAE